MENYLPESVLKKMPEKFSNAFKDFLNLNPEQRDYYDMKKNFENRKHKLWCYFESHRSLITKEDIKRTCASDPDEIDRILDQIESLI
ncbi:MAG TPA: hypothetical protein VJL89_04240 [Thermodesulfovibrionia bacterium]|nr:hypothetical protein [Thermodesulfovibrionia bacterium]